GFPINGLPADGLFIAYAGARGKPPRFPSAAPIVSGRLHVGGHWGATATTSGIHVPNQAPPFVSPPGYKPMGSVPSAVAPSYAIRFRKGLVTGSGPPMMPSWRAWPTTSLMNWSILMAGASTSTYRMRICNARTRSGLQAENDANDALDLLE